MRPVYTNIFAWSVSAGKDEVVLNAFQEFPDPDVVLEKEREIPAVKEHVASLAMTKDAAKVLYETLGRLLGEVE